MEFMCSFYGQVRFLKKASLADMIIRAKSALLYGLEAASINSTIELNF